MAKAKTTLKIEEFRATYSMLPSIPSPIIVPIDESSPFRKLGNIPEELLVHPPPKFNVAENIQQVIDDLKK